MAAYDRNCAKRRRLEDSSFCPSTPGEATDSPQYYYQNVPTTTEAGLEVTTKTDGTDSNSECGQPTELICFGMVSDPCIKDRVLAVDTDSWYLSLHTARMDNLSPSVLHSDCATKVNSATCIVIYNVVPWKAAMLSCWTCFVARKLSSSSSGCQTGYRKAGHKAIRRYGPPSTDHEILFRIFVTPFGNLGCFYKILHMRLGMSRTLTLRNSRTTQTTEQQDSRSCLRRLYQLQLLKTSK